MQTIVDNPDRAFLECVISEARFDIPLELTAGLSALSARLVKGQPGTVELSFEAPATTIQGNGVVCGGTLMTMLDYAMAFAVLSKLPCGQTCATTSITVNMQAAARPSLLKAVASVERVGRQIAFAKAELYDPQRELLVASASATFLVMAVNRFQAA
ncbi:PaaI family thioesterase [Pseudomonas batumici]|uniref:PaaI family thioesterase n=1 Tax=Pseudomonas batumici TaxID=226910 RepID=UPI00058A34A2|nr:PaaI family thioesterase [Pseudomonas batumici]